MAMSHGPGKIEREVTELFAAANDTDETFTVAELCGKVFGTSVPTGAQRVSILRAAHRAMRRSKQADRRRGEAWREAQDATEAKFGKKRGNTYGIDPECERFFNEHPAKTRHDRMAKGRLPSWRVTEREDGILVFHSHKFPVRVWAVQIKGNTLLWAGAEIIKITVDRVTIRYQKTTTSFERWKICWGKANWRGVYFTSSKEDFVFYDYDPKTGGYQQHQFEQPPEAMSIDEARRLLGVSKGFTREDIISGFRRAAKRCHPDHGGTAEMFHKLVEARDRLLASLGMNEPPPPTPTFFRSGAKIVTRRLQAGGQRLSGKGHARAIAG